LAALCLAALRMTGLAQSLPSQSPSPTFRSTVDLLTIDASVRDKRGLVIPDLQASDFTVTIDGRPRQVVSAVFYKADAAARARMSGGALPTPQHVSNESGQPGRIVIFALDTGTIEKRRERVLFKTASRMLDGLSAADAVGLYAFSGPSIEATRDHARVAKALAEFTGFGPTEAEVLAQGQNHDLTLRENTQGLLLELSSLLRRMSTVRAPRSVILISGGLALGSDFFPYAELQRAAAESRVTLYTVLVDQTGYDMSRGETRPDVAVIPETAEGLATVASRTGGMFFHGIATGAGVFDRIESEISSFYQLALESSPADADGKSREVKVKVNRTGLDVRAATHIAVPKPPKTAAPRDSLQMALRQPTDVSDVPLAVTAFSTHPAGDVVQLLISAEIGGPNGAAPAEWGFAVNQKEKNVVTRRGSIPAGSERPRVISTTIEVPRGEYRLRVAAVDADDRIGVLEIPITAGYQTTGATVVSDLIVGVAAAGELEPRRRIARSEDVTAMLEVRAAPGAVLGGTLQLVPSGSARSVLSTPLIVRRAASAGEPAILDARAKLASVPAGRYTASAALVMDGQPLTRISRIIEIK
jgi:VWFA-related protein